MSICNTFEDGLFIEIQAGKIAGIGRVLETEINTIGSMIDCQLQGWQAACRADQFNLCVLCQIAGNR